MSLLHDLTVLIATVPHGSVVHCVHLCNIKCAIWNSSQVICHSLLCVKKIVVRNWSEWTELDTDHYIIFAFNLSSMSVLLILSDTNTGKCLQQNLETCRWHVGSECTMKHRLPSYLIILWAIHKYWDDTLWNLDSLPNVDETWQPEANILQHSIWRDRGTTFFYILCCFWRTAPHELKLLSANWDFYQKFPFIATWFSCI
jgi:hypothetical protein